MHVYNYHYINNIQDYTKGQFQTFRALSSPHTAPGRSINDDKYALDYALDDEKITSMRFLCFNRHIGFDDVYR